jgi:hypothetical protein
MITSKKNKILNLLFSSTCTQNNLWSSPSLAAGITIELLPSFLPSFDSLHCPPHMAWEWYSPPHFSFLVCLFVCFGMWALHGLSILWFIYIACLLQVLYIIRSIGVRKGVRGGGRGGSFIRWGERGQIHPPCFHGAHISLSLYYGQLGMGGERGYKEYINPQPLLNYGMQLSCMWIFIEWGGHSLYVLWNTWDKRVFS